MMNSPRHSIRKKRSKNVKRYEIQPINVLEQEPLALVTLEEFFPIGFFEKVMVNITSYFKLEEEEDEGSDKYENSLRVANKTLTILELARDKSFIFLMRCADMLLLPYNAQNFTLKISRMWEDQ